MQRTLSVVFVIIFGYLTPLYSQVRLDSWRSHSSMNIASDVTVDDKGNYWVSTSGGVFKYNPVENEFEEFRNIGALTSINCTSIEYDEISHRLYVGSDNGDIDILDNSGNWTHITDIRYAKNLTKKRINGFLFVNNKVFVAGDFGLIDYSYEGAPGTYAQRLGSFSQQTEVKQLLKWNDTLVAITPVGIALTSIVNNSLGNPSTWRNITTTEGLISNDCHSASVLNDSLYIGHNWGISSYKNGIAKTSLKINEQNTLDKILKIDTDNSSIIYSNVFFLLRLNSDRIGGSSFNPFSEHKTIVKNGTVYLFTLYTQNGGIGIQKGDKQEKFIPVTPYANLFTSLSVDTRGILWASGDRDRGTGSYALRNGEWRNYHTSTRKDITEDATYKVATFSDGSIWLGSWGGGITKVLEKGDDFEFTRYTNTNSPLVGLKGSEGFVVTGIAEKDNENTTWVPTFAGESEGPLLVAFREDGNHKGFFAPLIMRKRSFTEVAVDLSGTKWFVSRDDDGMGYFNEKNTFDNTNDDVWGLLNTSNSGLLDNNPSCLAVDKNGVLWIGTSAGINVVYNTSNASRSGGKVTVSKLQTVTNQVVRDIAVDAVNNKWVATNQGVFVLNDDGSEVLSIINTSNAPLVSNDIKAIALDDNTGKVYFGTEQGLSEATSLSVLPLQDYDISVYPQPYNPEKDAELVIEGLSENSSVHIVTIDGRKVRSLSTKSRKTVWDGKDNDGNYVQTGVYLLNGVSSSNDKSGVTKIAVNRK